MEAKPKSNAPLLACKKSLVRSWVWGVKPAVQDVG